MDLGTALGEANKNKLREGEVTRVGRYQLTFELASGGMATVYLARTEGPAGFDKVVALKRIHPHLAKEGQFIDMFLDEARIASRISHPNVCSVFDFGEADGSYFIAMEYVMGETVSRLVRRLRRDKGSYKDPRLPGFAARIISGACDGLHAAHELKDDDGNPLEVVHRDVSPQNLFLAYDGTVRVVDFGVARAAGRLHETRTGIVKGKLAYMPPEQARKQKVDRRADVWALGAVLWELLCAKRLFKRENDVETILAVINDPIHAPSAVRDTVPEELDRIVLKALSRDREERYATTREMGRDLHKFLGKLDEPVTSGDLSDWMDGLFPEEKAHRIGLVAAARKAKVGAVAPVDDVLLDEHSGSEVRPVISDTDVKADVPGLDAKTTPRGAALVEGAMATPVTGASEPEVLAPRRLGVDRRLYLFGALLLLGALLGVVAMTLGEDEEPVAVAVAEGPASVLTDLAEAEVEAETEAETGAEAETEAEAEAEAEPVAHQEIEELEEVTIVAPSAAPAPAAMVTARRAVMVRRGGMNHRPAMASTGTGHVAIATPGGWADVYLNGRRLGRAPGRVAVPSGRHVLELRPFGRGPARRTTVNVAAGESARVVVRLGS